MWMVEAKAQRADWCICWMWPFPADVLFPSLQREHKGPAALFVQGLPHDRPAFLTNSFLQAKNPK